MRYRWITLLGRIGSILIAVALTLILLSSISPSTLHEYPVQKFTFGPEKYSYVTSGVYLPNIGCRILATSNESLQIYFLAIYPDNLTNVSVLEAFLQARPEDVLLKGVIKEEQSIDFFPPKAANVTVVVSNPSLTTVDVSVKVTIISTRVPIVHTTMFIEIFTAFGIALVLPKIIMESKRRKTNKI